MVRLLVQILYYLSNKNAGRSGFRAWTVSKKVVLPQGLDYSNGMGFLDIVEQRLGHGFPDSKVISVQILRDL
jgi:hypothetical protein